jgi:hypothetical protein
VLKWANAILDNWTSLQQEIATLRSSSGTLTGHLSVGVIASALPMAALMTTAVQAHHPAVLPRSAGIDRGNPCRSTDRPLVEHNVGLVVVDRDPISPLVIAAFECAKETEPPAISRRK